MLDGSRPGLVQSTEQNTSGGMEREGHSDKFANAFASILADEQPEGPVKKKLKKAPKDTVRRRLMSHGS